MADDDEPFSSSDVSAGYVDLLVRQRDNSQAWADAVLFDGGDPDDPTAAELDQLPAASLTAALTFHLPGKHDQKTHGNRGGGPSLSKLTKLLDKADMGQLEEEFDRLLGGRFGGLSMAVTYVDGENKLSTEDPYIDARFTVIGEHGRHVGEGSVTIQQNPETGRWFLHEPGLKLNKDVQGGSFATEFYSKWTKWAIANKLTHVEITADLDIGGYAWAAQGWDFPTAGAGRQMIGIWAARIRAGHGGGGPHGGPDIKYPKPTPEEEAAVQAIVSRATDDAWGTPDFPKPIELAQFGRQPGQGGRAAVWPGKAALMGMYWSAVVRFE